MKRAEAQRRVVGPWRIVACWGYWHMKNNRMNNWVRFAAALITALSVAHALPAIAAVPLGHQQVTLNGVRTINSNLAAPLFVERAGSPYGYAAASALGMPTVTARVNTARAGIDSISTRAGLDYFVQINGPAFIGTIPIIYESTLRASTGTNGGNSNTGNATAQFVLQSYSTNPDGSLGQNLTNQSWFARAVTNFRTGGIGDSHDSYISGVFELANGNLLATAIIADVDAAFGGFASAFADPYFYIDPTFAAEHPGYTLSLSQSVGNDAPNAGVPEPATWALMIGGFGLTGTMLRRRLAVTT